MIVQQGPGVDGSARFFSQGTKAGDEIVAILVVFDNFAAFNATQDDMV